MGGQVGADLATACSVQWWWGEKTRWGGQVGADLATACCVRWWWGCYCLLGRKMRE